jgi:hypothetical protein
MEPVSHVPNSNNCVQTALDTPFGKDYISHSFSAAVQLCHVLLLMFKSGYLSVWTSFNFMHALQLARQLNWLCQRYGDLNFPSLPDGIPANLSRSDFIAYLHGLVTACFLHHNFDTPTVVPYIGGQNGFTLQHPCNSTQTKASQCWP